MICHGAGIEIPRGAPSPCAAPSPGIARCLRPACEELRPRAPASYASGISPLTSALGFKIARPSSIGAVPIHWARSGYATGIVPSASTAVAHDTPSRGGYRSLAEQNRACGSCMTLSHRPPPQGSNDNGQSMHPRQTRGTPAAGYRLTGCFALPTLAARPPCCRRAFACPVSFG